MIPVWIAAVAITCLVICTLVYLKVRYIVRLIGQCPLCHKDTLYTVQRCLACQFHREHAHKLPNEV